MELLGNSRTPLGKETSEVGFDKITSHSQALDGERMTSPKEVVHLHKNKKNIGMLWWMESGRKIEDDDEGSGLSILGGDGFERGPYKTINNSITLLSFPYSISAIWCSWK